MLSPWFHPSPLVHTIRILLPDIPAQLRSLNLDPKPTAVRGAVSDVRKSPGGVPGVRRARRLEDMRGSDQHVVRVGQLGIHETSSG